MKRNTIMAVLLMMAAWTFAQEGTVNLGANIGFQQSENRYRSLTNSEKSLDASRSGSGFTAGLAMEANIVKGFGMYMGLNYSLGAKVGGWKTEATGMRIKSSYTLHVLEVPVDWQYKFEIAKQTYLMLYTGPTLHIGLAQKERTQTKLGNNLSSDMTQDLYSVDLDKDKKTDLNRVNVLWGVGAGFQYKQYYLRGGYDFGIMNAYKDAWYYDNRQNKGRMDQWQIKLGIFFHQF